ncbi:transmembrane protein 223 [Episyrphus balteatus]|uniref:transmembrane protein 223 n=1 Tax=Episyrphus balteatus TaxID=286459 RepID=UPI002485C12C|nr:transmembrane protein 223 [Episyrphus balteatus]
MALFLNTIIRRSVANIKANSFRIFGNSLTQHSSLVKNQFVNKLSPSQPSSNLCTKAYDVSTNVAKDIILFKYENPKFFKMLNIFAIVQFLFWNYLSHSAFTTLRDAPVDEAPEDAAWYRQINLGENKYRNGITVSCFLIGYGILAVAWMYTLRSVRFLVLRKGGKELSFVTYGPFNKNRIITVPMNCVTAMESRGTARVQLPIKIKNKSFFYILDMRGEFKNTKLFDYTAGLSRKL